MDKEHIRQLIAQQKQFYATNTTKDVAWRKKQLHTLKHCIQEYTPQILGALHKDVHKPAFEAYTGEVYQVLAEINYFIKYITCLAKPRQKPTPLTLWPAQSSIQPTPYGSVLIMAPWNFPFQLNMLPLVGAIAAGNCAVVKPSEFAPYTAAIIEKIIKQCFVPEYVTVVQGGIKTAQALLDQAWDYIFFTGSTKVGKIVMQKAAEHVTPLTLELGGKNPCIVDASACLDVAAKRIAWGAFYNAGQNCVAPDYILVNEQCKSLFIEKLKNYIKRFFKDSKEYARIINTEHFNRLQKLMEHGTIVFGGRVDEQALFIEPTILDDVSLDSPLMQEEIFGPLLPILTYQKLDNALKIINDVPKPLAVYLFAQNRCVQQKVLAETTSGAVCINDVLMQAASLYLPFGGVGASGFGRYHGKYSFATFSYDRTVLKKSRFDLLGRYPPYNWLSRCMQKLLSWLVHS